MYLLYRVIKKSLCTWRLQYKNQVHRDFLITLYNTHIYIYIYIYIYIHTNKCKKNVSPQTVQHSIFNNTPYVVQQRCFCSFRCGYAQGQLKVSSWSTHGSGNYYWRVLIDASIQNKYGAHFTRPSNTHDNSCEEYLTQNINHHRQNLSARRFLTHCDVEGRLERVRCESSNPHFLLWSLLSDDLECTHNMNQLNDYPRMAPQWSHLWTTVRTDCGTL
jgi:hypothetical protein